MALKLDPTRGSMPRPWTLPSDGQSFNAGKCEIDGLWASEHACSGCQIMVGPGHMEKGPRDKLGRCVTCAAGGPGSDRDALQRSLIEPP